MQRSLLANNGLVAASSLAFLHQARSASLISTMPARTGSTQQSQWVALLRFESVTNQRATLGICGIIRGNLSQVMKENARKDRI